MLILQASDTRNMKLCGFIFLLWCRVCLSRKEPNDVTIIVNATQATQNASDAYTEIHLGTNALGLPVIVNGELKNSDYEFLLEPGNQNQWEVLNWRVTSTEDLPFTELNNMQQGEFGLLSPDHQSIANVSQVRIDLSLYEEKNSLCRYFKFCLAPNRTPLPRLPFFYCVVLHQDDCGSVALYTCDKEYDNNSWLDLDGTNYKCKKTSFMFTQIIRYGENNITWYIKQIDGVIEFMRDRINFLPVFKWSSPITMKYYRMFIDDRVQAEVIHYGYVLETSSSRTQLRSPAFTPEYKHMCLVIVFHAENSLQHSMRVYAVDSLSNQIQLGVIGNSSKAGWQIERIITPWPENITLNPISVMIKTSDTESRIKVARISSCNGEDGVDVRVVPKTASAWDVFSLTVPVLKERDSETLERYPIENVMCKHNGTKTDQDMCVCLPGFTSSQCKKSCGRNRFGRDCKGKCSFHTSECRGLFLCVPDFGCWCAPGYKGKTCEEECESGTYGNNCMQTCGHCEEGTCDIYSGECLSCLPGYQLPLCKHKFMFTNSAPVVSVTRFGEVTVKPIISNINDNSTLDFYSIQYKKNFTSDSWVSHSIHPIPRTGDVQETVIKDLEHGVPYKVRTVLIDRDFNSYQGEDIPAADFLSLCIIPERVDYHLESESNQTSFTVSWSYILKNAYECRVEKFEVSWKEGWKWLTSFTNNTYLTVADLLPSTAVRFKVRALTSKGFAPFSPTILISTKDNGALTVPVENLRVETVDSKTAVIEWDPPLGRYNMNLSYSVKYKCLRQVACQKNCEESADELHIFGTHIKLAVLYPFSQYLVTVSPNGGPSRSIILGTKMSAPTEIPELSLRPPVRTNNSITVYWNRPEVCSGIFTNYVFQFYKVGDMQLVETGSTVNTSVSFDNLQASTDYKVFVYVQTFFGDINPSKYLEINVSTFATVPEKVQNLTVYKQGRYMLGLRWASPNKTYGSIVSFTIKYGYREDTYCKTEIVKPNPCVAWPNLFCHTIKSLQVNKVYKISVSARNSEVDADGASVEVTGITKENSPGAPENVKVVNTTINSLLVQWDHPWMANGIVRSFLISVEETEQFDNEKCCQVYPIIETTVTDEQEHYSIEVAGLNAASTYIVSIAAKTVALGSAQSITVHTRPPSLTIAQLPNVTVNGRSDILMWLPQHNFTNSSDLYRTLIKGSLLLVLSNDTEFNGSGITDKELDSELKNIFTEDFYVAAEYMDIVPTTHIELGTGESDNGNWGKIRNLHLQKNNTYQLAAVQVAEYCGVYGVYIVWSSPFVVP